MGIRQLYVLDHDLSFVSWGLTALLLFILGIVLSAGDVMNHKASLRHKEFTIHLGSVSQT